MPRWLTLVITLAFCFALLNACAGPVAQTAQQNTAAAQPGQPTEQVLGGMYYHSGLPVTEGWNGLPWKASLAEFKALFPGAVQSKGDGSWMTGQGDESFFDFDITPEYFFDQKDQFIAVAFTSQDRKLTQPLVTKVVNTLGLPQNKRPVWTYGQVTVFVVHHSVVIRGVPPEN